MQPVPAFFDGTGIIVICRIKHLEEALRTAFISGLDVRRFELREPTLHDAFIDLTGDDPGQDQRQTETRAEEAAR